MVTRMSIEGNPVKKTLIILLLLVANASVAFGHAGETHSYMGTVSTINEDGSFILKKTDGSTLHVLVAKATAYLHADDKPATAADLKAGMRVVAKISKDGKTALSVKMAARK
jgi:multidrug efflux pump subunit AcrA (membrane-fusion protein)